MFEKIEDVPAAIAAFYTTETRQVQQFNDDETPVMQEVDYPTFDEDGNPTTITRLEPVYLPVDFVVPVSVPEFKGWDDVWRIVALHKGTRDDLIRQFLGMVCNAQQWAFHDEYIEWMVDEPDMDDEAFLVPDESGENPPSFSAELYQAAHTAWQGDEPVKPAKIDVDQWFYDHARELRRHAYAPPNVQNEMYFDDVVNGTTTLIDHNYAVKVQYPFGPDA